MKTDTCKLYFGAFWIFLPNVIKIDPHNFELCAFKVGAFFSETQCIIEDHVNRTNEKHFSHKEPTFGNDLREIATVCTYMQND